MPVVRTVFQPDVDLEVDEAEAESLKRSGLLAPLTGAPIQGEAGPGLLPLPAAAAVTPPAPAGEEPPTSDTEASEPKKGK